MEEERVFKALIWFQFLRALLGLRSSRGVRLYGRHLSPAMTSSVSLPARLAWFLMEAPTVIIPALVFPRGRHSSELVPKALILLFEVHYVHRTFIYPMRLSGDATRMPAVTTVLAAAFNAINAYIQVRWVSHFGSYAQSWLAGPRFVLGSAIFVSGMALNVWADGVLLGLRREGKPDKKQAKGYKIPGGGIYEYVSCPNYLGECLEWLGWAVATWSAAGLSFFVFTVATLAPRAAAHHRWYLRTFPSSYPLSRRAMVPFVF